MACAIRNYFHKISKVCEWKKKRTLEEVGRWLDKTLV